MNGVHGPDASAPARYANGYERLRGRAVRSGAVRDRDGLAVLVQRGVAAWLDALAAVPVPALPAAARAPRSREPLPTDVESRAVDILAAMVRPHLAAQA